MVHCSEQAMVPAISDLQKPQDLTDDGKSGKAKGSSGLSDQRVVGSNPAWGAYIRGLSLRTPPYLAVFLMLLILSDSYPDSY